jgi:erythromycin esterase-like protein
MSAYHNPIASQPNLFEASTHAEFPNRAPLAARGDPVTSTIAADELTRSGVRANQKRALLDWMRRDGGTRTSAEIAHHGGFDRYMAARRLPDLARDSLVRRCDPKACTVTGHLAVTWKAAAGGGN